jgi:hypothetical protein
LTIEEYAKEIGSALRDAYNRKQRQDVESTFRLAQNTLDRSNISRDARQRFWKLVQEEFYSGHLLMERQAVSELHRLMRDIEARLAENQKGNE